MTLNVTSHGETRQLTDIELVEQAIREAPGGRDALAALSEGFIEKGIRQGCSLERIVSIALGKEHLLPKETP